MIIYQKLATHSISVIVYFIEKQGFPQNAINYEARLYEFSEGLQNFPEKYQICRFEKYMKKGYRCAPFENYIFVYRIQVKDIIVINVVHSKRLNI
ncbi:MAG: hypothetical protein HW421_3114 [Ignavibacteria bacterium]|nr:hypothetical protein [Ignavibacteria bacterium]